MVLVHPWRSMQRWGQGGKKPQGEGLCCDHPPAQPSGIMNEGWV